MKKSFINVFYSILILLFSLFFLTVSILFFFGKDLPSFDKLSSYKPRLVSKIYTANGNFLEDYSNENRVFIKYEDIPTDLINCFLVSEDINFYNHDGIDYRGILRAFLKNVSNTFTNKRVFARYLLYIVVLTCLIWKTNSSVIFSTSNSFF